MELCTDVSPTVLILAISRFSSRRGLPKLFVSDNFKSFKSIELKNFLLKGGIKWQFLLEKLPWGGGFYEHLVGIVKNSLKKVIGKALCNYEQFTTYLCKIGRAINQRPFTYVADENYEEVLTPYHRIFGRNSDDNCTTDFYEMTSDNVRANFRCKGSYCLYLKGVSKQSTLRHYEKNIFITNHTFCKIIALLLATLSQSKKRAFQG